MRKGKVGIEFAKALKGNYTIIKINFWKHLCKKNIYS